MKKIITISIVILAVFLIYLCNIDRKVYYLALGDSLATGQDAYGKKIKGYPSYIKDYLKEKGILEIYIYKYARNGKRTTDLINDIKYNKKVSQNNKTINLQNALIKADLVTISIGANDILNKISQENLDYNQIYNYIDELSIDLEKLLKLMRQYCKEDIILVGYYNPYPDSKKSNARKAFNYLNKKYKEISHKYNVTYVEIENIFNENPNFLPNENDIHPSKEGYKAISGEIIGTINKTMLKP